MWPNVIVNRQYYQMRNLYHRFATYLLVLFMGLSVPAISLAQCVNTTSGSQSGCTRSNFFDAEYLPNAGCGSFRAITNYSPGEYFRVPVLNGGCYSISTCGAPFDTQINCFRASTTSSPFAYNDDSGPNCSGSAASVTMVPNFSDYARVDVRQYACRPGGQSSITVYLRQNNNLSITNSTASMCQGQTRTLSAVPTPTVSSLSGAGQPGVFSGSGVSGTTFTAPVPSGPGQSYVITYTFGYCTTTRGISVFHAPSTSNAGANQTVCSSSASISANNPTFGSGSWSVVTGTGTITSTSSPSTSVTGLLPGQSVTLRWTITNGPCTASTSTVTISRDEDPTVAMVGPDLQVCTDTAQLSANSPTIGSGSWTVISGSGTFANATNPNTMVTGMGLGQNSFAWSISNGICNITKDTITVQRDNEAPQPFAGPDKAICGSSTTLTGNLPSFGSGTWAIISGSGVVTNPNQPNSGLTGVNVGTTVLTWNIGNGTCPVRKDTIVITRNALPTAPLISGSQNVCEGSSLQLTATSGVGSPTYSWWDSPTGGNILVPGAVYNTPPISGSITVYAQVTDDNTTCTSTRTPHLITANPLPTVSLGADETICSNDSACFDAGAGNASYLWNTGATTQTFCTNVTGTYWVQITDNNGCTAYDTVNVTSFAPPSVNLGPDVTLCTGSTRNIGVPSQGGMTYLWSNGATTSMTTVSTGGTYTLTVTDGNSCEAVDDIIVNQVNIPVAAFSIDTSNCPTVVFTDQSTDATSWTWSFGLGTGPGSGSQSPSHNYASTGNNSYIVTLISTGVCGSDTISETVDISCIVGIELPSNLEVAVFPNPNDGKFKLRFNGLEDDLNLTIFNNLGQLVYEKELTGIRGDHDEEVDITGVASGIYYAKMVVGGVGVTKRIIVR